MREIKFRGEDIKGNWHYGLLTHDKNPSFKSDYEWFISNSKGKPYAYGVIESSIGQYTGLKDKNGVEIYEGDIVKHLPPMINSGEIYTVVFDDYTCSFMAENRYGMNMLSQFQRLEVIGNIHS